MFMSMAWAASLGLIEPMAAGRGRSFRFHTGLLSYPNICHERLQSTDFEFGLANHVGMLLLYITSLLPKLLGNTKSGECLYYLVHPPIPPPTLQPKSLQLVYNPDLKCIPYHPFYNTHTSLLPATLHSQNNHNLTQYPIICNLNYLFHPMYLIHKSL